MTKKQEEIIGQLTEDVDALKLLVDTLTKENRELTTRYGSAQHNYEAVRQWYTISSNEARYWKEIADNLQKIINQPPKNGMLTL